MIGVLGVVFFVINAAFATVLLLMILFASGYAIFSKNPDTRYQPMRDDRGSFIKSQTNLTTELDALGATARGDMRMKLGDDDDSDSYMSGSVAHQQRDASGVPLPSSAATSTRNFQQYDPPRSPITSNTPFMPSDGAPRHGQPMPYSDNPGRNLYSGSGYEGYSSRSANSSSPAPRFNNNNQNYDRSESMRSNVSRGPPQQGGSSGMQWQRGAGYDH